MEFQLPGSSAIIRAQHLQLERDTAGSAKAVAKKNKDELAKLDKAKSALTRFQGPDKMRSSDEKTIIDFVLPWYLSTEAVSNCQTIPVIQAKLDEISRKHKKTWGVFMRKEPMKARVKLPATDVSRDIDD